MGSLGLFRFPLSEAILDMEGEHTDYGAFLLKLNLLCITTM